MLSKKAVVDEQGAKRCLLFGIRSREHWRELVLCRVSSASHATEVNIVSILGAKKERCTTI